MRTAKKSRRDPLTRRELAACLGVHVQTVTKWTREGMPIAVRGRGGRPCGFRELAVRRWRAARAARGGDPAKARARKDDAQAALAEQLLASRSRRLLPVDEVERAWGTEIAAVRAALLAWPTILADKLHRVSTLEGLAGVERVLHEAVYDALRELADPNRSAESKPPATLQGETP